MSETTSLTLTSEQRAKASLGISANPIYRAVADALIERHSGGGTLIDVGCGAGNTPCAGRLARGANEMGYNMNKIKKNYLSIFINIQGYLSNQFDKILPERFRVHGLPDFNTSFVPKYLRYCLKVYDVGGGKIPCIDHRRKAELGLTVVGLDIDREELRRAPQGAYDEMISPDITRFKGGGDADLIICQAVLEHVKDVEGAFAAMASILKPGGKALLYVPSRNAIFARLNLAIPEGMKRKILFTFFPGSQFCGGFPCYYDRCTPSQFHLLAERHGLEVEEERTYFISSYFSIFFPAYFVWRIWILLFRLIAGDQAAESFSMALRKTAPADT